MEMNFTPEAKQTIQRMNDRCNAIGAWFGPDHKYTIGANRSLRASLTTMISLGGNISSDGELSLYGYNEFIAYGVNFSRTILPDDPEYPYLKDQMRAAGLDPNNFVGTWSVNS